MFRSVFVFSLIATCSFAEVRQFKPGFNLFSKEQDVQLGREAAAQVERQMQVIHDPFLESYIKRIGQKLASQPQAGGFTYTFQVVNDPSINAFALPGGPTFVNTGLIKAAENEAQLAGVLAHEISHCALRHGTNQASKANLLQLPAALAGAMMGGSMLGQLAQLGVGLGFNSVLLKFSRSAESQADLNGAQMMSNAGYNPLELARFFEKLEAQGGHGGPQFLSDHPNPGNRMKAIQDEIQQMPQRNYSDGNMSDLQRAKQIVAQLPPPRKQAAGLGSTPTGADPRPSGQFRQVSGNGFSLSVPSNWETFGDSNGAAMTIAPRSALAQDKSGNVQVGMGLMVNMYFPNGNRADLNRDTQDLVSQLRRANPTMDVGSQKRTRVDGQDALVTTLYSQSPYQGETEHDMLVTVPRPDGLFYVIFITPAKAASQVSGAFDQMMQSIRFR